MTAPGPTWREAAAYLERRFGRAPEAAVIAGSGLSGLADRLTGASRVPYVQVPGWPLSTVPGHAGELAFGTLGGRATAVACGRVHLYEGLAAERVVFGVRALAAWGARLLVVTNAAGALADDLAPGALLVIRDHLYLPGMAGWSPLAGPNDPELGPRFPSLSAAYDPALRRAALDAASKCGLAAREGIYAMVAGPSYETPAEARLLRAWGADAVGMSTCPEVVAARHAGLAVLGLSLITNRVDRSGEPAEVEDLHDEVAATGAAHAGAVAKVIEQVLGAPDARHA